MTFIKNNVSSNAPLSTDLRNIFIGRATELDFFIGEILQPEEPKYNIISIWGNAGVGKSTLLTKFIDLTHSSDFKDYCLTAQVDERQATPANIMEKFADQLRLSGYPLVDFEKAVASYKEIVRQLHTWPAAHREISTQSLVLSTISSMFDPSQNFSSNPREKTSFFFQDLESNYLYRQLTKDLARIEDPIGDLTTSFISDLNRLANTTVALSSRHAKHQRRVLLFFDTFEQLALDTVPWLLNYFLEANINSNIVLVVAGRLAIERSIQGYQRNWQKYKSAIHPLPLESFTEDETRNYLTAQNITEPKRISTLLKLSRGLPYSLSLLTSNAQGEVDVTKDVVDNFLRGIPEHEEVRRQLALEAALLTKPFNLDDLKAFIYLSEDDRPILYRWLSEQPFVRSNPLDGRHSYHDLARETFARHLYQISLAQYQNTRKALADYYQYLLEKVQAESGKGINRHPQWLELVIALVHQLLLLTDGESHIKAIESILEAHPHTSKQQDGEIIRFLRDIAQDEPTNMANVDARKIASYLIQYIETNPDKRVQEFLAATSFLIEKLGKTPSNLTLLSRIYRNRGLAFFSLMKYQQAMADFDQALKYNSSSETAYLSRARLYIQLDRHEDALLDLNRVIEIKPDNIAALANRGQVYKTKKCYEEALADFERIIESNQESRPLGYFLKGSLLYMTGRYQEAVDSLKQALIEDPTSENYWILLARAYQALHPYNEVPGFLKALSVQKANSASVITNRAIAMNKTRNFEEAIVETSLAIKIDPQNVQALVERGKARGELHQFEEALNDFSSVLELKPKEALARIYRAQTFNFLKRYPEALHDLNTTISYDLKNAFAFYSRSQTYQYMKQYREALNDLDHVLELDEDFEHKVQEKKAELLQNLDKNDEALNNLKEALKTKVTCQECWISLAELYANMYSRKEIPRLLREIPVPDDKNLSVVACRAVAMNEMRYEEEAMVELTPVLEIDPDNKVALTLRSKIYSHRGRYAEALSDVEHLEELERGPRHEKQERIGLLLQKLGRNEEALTAFKEALKTNATCDECWINLVMTYEVLEDRRKTVTWLREWSQSSFDESAVLTYCANALSETGHYEEALLMFTEALNLKLNEIESIVSRGQIYHILKLYEKALADFNEALRRTPNNPEALLNRGQTYYQMNRHNDALKDFDLALKSDPDFEHIGQQEKGLAFYSLQRYQEAVAAFSQALKIDPTCKECWMRLAKTYEISFGRSQLPKLMRAIPISTTDKALVIARRANIFRQMGYYQEALADFDYAFSLDKTIIYYEIDSRGLVLSYLERYAEAIECYQQGLKYEQNDYQGLYNIAVTMARWKGVRDTQKYIDIARKALLTQTHTVYRGSAFYGLGGLAAVQGDTYFALDYLKKALTHQKESIEWVQHDIAWLDLRSDSHFQTLILNEQQENETALVIDSIKREEQQQGMSISIDSRYLHPPKVFLCYSPDDRAVVQDLFHRLQADGIDPWLDVENLLPGQEKEVAIRKAVRSSNAVIVCLSHNAIQRVGNIHKQMVYALDIADEQPEDRIFLIPLQLENCDIPERLSRWHSVNLLDEQGYNRLVDALRTNFPGST